MWEELKGFALRRVALRGVAVAVAVGLTIEGGLWLCRDGWFGQHPAEAEWAAAVGTVGAIAVALWATLANKQADQAHISARAMVLAGSGSV